MKLCTRAPQNLAMPLVEMKEFVSACFAVNA